MRLRRWMLTGLLVLSGVLAAAGRVADGEPVVGAALAAVFFALGFVFSPRAFPASLAAAEAQARSAEDGRPVVYWRPGCRYCMRLRVRLGRDARRVHWVDIWSDPAGAAAVRAVTGGDETVPTVVIAGEGFVNPDPDWLRRRLAQAT